MVLVASAAMTWNALHTETRAAETAATSMLPGTWSGSGRVYYTDNSTESLRCSGYYTGGGSELHMAIQCKSESRDIHIRSKLKISGDKVSGEWEERTFNATGSATGSAGANTLSLSLAGGGFSGNMSVSFSKTSHTVTITTQGIGMSRATINFGKS